MITSANSNSRAPAATAKSRGAVPKASEKRKAQNRAAQKTYREKRKKRLQQLEQLAAEKGLLNRGDDASDAPPAGLVSDSSPESASQSPPDITTPENVLGYSGQTSDPTRLNSSFGPRILDLDEPNTFDELINDQSWLNPDFSYDLSTSLITTNSQTTNPQWPLTNLQAYNDSSSSSEISADDLLNTPLTFADPITNNLTLYTTTTLSAFLQNLLHLGITSFDCCDEQQPSIFYRPDISASSNALTLVSAVQQSYTTIKPDLRPTLKQITTAHPGYIDILPFKDMRDRLIELLTADPPMVDEDEFWQDMDSGGLVCWGSMAPSKGVTAGGAGAPWDARSWEAKTWFLAKWNWVVGGEESELGRASAWWRCMRGTGQGFSF